MRQDDLIRELEKAREALQWTEKHLVAVNQANAALHINETVWHSPLTTQVHNARESMERVLADLKASKVDDHGVARPRYQDCNDRDRLPAKLAQLGMPQ
jgi:hypothetical protein